MSNRDVSLVCMESTKPLSKKTCVITGPTHGIGRVTALSLGKLGAKVLLLCRDVKKGNALAEELRRYGGKALVIQADLSSLRSVADAASEVMSIAPTVDILINNAATVNADRRITVDGLEEMFAVNYLAHFLLTKNLLPVLKAAPAARIIHVASGAYTFVPKLYINDYNWEQRPFRTFPVYGHSKLACMLFNYQLAHHLKGASVTTNALDPGAVATGLGRVNLLWKAIYWLATPFFLTPEQGAETSIYLASHGELINHNGGYFVKCKPKPLDPLVSDSSVAEQLWSLSEKLVASF